MFLLTLPGLQVARWQIERTKADFEDRTCSGRAMRLVCLEKLDLSSTAAGPSSPRPSPDSSLFPGTCSSFPLVFGCSNVAC